MQDEIRDLDKEIEERHAAELAAAEARSGQKQTTPAEATVASLSAGLYSTKLTADQPSDRKEPTRAQKRRELRALEEVMKHPCLPSCPCPLGGATTKHTPTCKHIHKHFVSKWHIPVRMPAAWKRRSNTALGCGWY